jgi:hypothetical protein
MLGLFMYFVIALSSVSVAGIALVYVLGIIVRAVAPRMARGEDRGRAEDSVAEPR